MLGFRNFTVFLAATLLTISYVAKASSSNPSPSSSALASQVGTREDGVPYWDGDISYWSSSTPIELHPHYAVHAANVEKFHRDIDEGLVDQRTALSKAQGDDKAQGHDNGGTPQYKWPPSTCIANRQVVRHDLMIIYTISLMADWWSEPGNCGGAFWQPIFDSSPIVDYRPHHWATRCHMKLTRSKAPGGESAKTLWVSPFIYVAVQVDCTPGVMSDILRHVSQGEINITCTGNGDEKLFLETIHWNDLLPWNWDITNLKVKIATWNALKHGYKCFEKFWLQVGDWVTAQLQDQLTIGFGPRVSGALDSGHKDI